MVFSGMRQYNNKLKLKMKKYFIAGTKEEAQLGDVIEKDVTETLENGRTKHRHLECVLVPETLEVLVDAGLIEVQEIEEVSKEEKVPYNEFELALLQNIENLCDEVKNLKMEILELKKKAATKAKN